MRVVPQELLRDLERLLVTTRRVMGSGLRPGAPMPSRYRRARVRRRALPMTDTELMLMAAAASMGLRRIPKKG